MADEFNGGRSYDNDTRRENAAPEETSAFEETGGVDEIASYDEVPKAAKKKSGKSLSRLLSTLTAAVAAVATVGVIAPAVIDTDKTAVEFAEVWSTETSVGYDIRLEGRTGDKLVAVVYNDFTERVSEIEGDEFSYEETGLKPGVQYTVAVRNGDKTLAETKLRTKFPHEVLVTEMRSVTYECTCYIDGKFHFWLDFVDENNYWSDFRATLTDAYGTVSACAIADDPTAEQTIEVTETELLGRTATFRVVCASAETGDAETVLYESQVRI